MTKLLAVGESMPMDHLHTPGVATCTRIYAETTGNLEPKDIKPEYYYELSHRIKTTIVWYCFDWIADEGTDLPPGLRKASFRLSAQALLMKTA